jgi:hypothetical protein
VNSLKELDADAYWEGSTTGPYASAAASVGPAALVADAPAIVRRRRYPTATTVAETAPDALVRATATAASGCSRLDHTLPDLAVTFTTTGAAAAAYSRSDQTLSALAFASAAAEPAGADIAAVYHCRPNWDRQDASRAL